MSTYTQTPNVQRGTSHRIAFTNGEGRTVAQITTTAQRTQFGETLHGDLDPDGNLWIELDGALIGSLIVAPDQDGRLTLRLGGYQVDPNPAEEELEYVTTSVLREPDARGATVDADHATE